MGDKIDAIKDRLSTLTAGQLAVEKLIDKYRAEKAEDLEFRRYSFYNMCMIALQEPRFKFPVAPFSQWKRFGRPVVKGSKALWIYAPTFYGERRSTRSMCRREEIAQEKRLEDEAGKQGLKGFKLVPVFHCGQTTGAPLNRELYQPPPDQGPALPTISIETLNQHTPVEELTAESVTAYAQKLAAAWGLKNGADIPGAGYIFCKSYAG